MSCRDVRERLVAYADDELGVDATLAVTAHLERCQACRDDAVAQRAFRRVVGAMYPRRAAPDALRRRILAPSRPPRRTFAAAALAASLVVVASAWMLRAPASDGLPAEVGAALGLHEAAERGQVSLGLASSDLPAVNRWLARELPFAVPIPGGQTDALRVAGAASVELGAARAAWVVYRGDGTSVSLFVLPPRAWPPLGRAIHHRGIEFRTVDVGGHRIVAWNHEPVSYLLVSARERGAGEACGVCHAGPEVPALAGFAEAHGS